MNMNNLYFNQNETFNNIYLSMSSLSIPFFCYEKHALEKFMGFHTTNNSAYIDESLFSLNNLTYSFSYLLIKSNFL